MPGEIQPGDKEVIVPEGSQTIISKFTPKRRRQNQRISDVVGPLVLYGTSKTYTPEGGEAVDYVEFKCKPDVLEAAAYAGKEILLVTGTDETETDEATFEGAVLSGESHIRDIFSVYIDQVIRDDQSAKVISNGKKMSIAMYTFDLIRHESCPFTRLYGLANSDTIATINDHFIEAGRKQMGEFLKENGITIQSEGVGVLDPSDPGEGGTAI